MSISPKVLKDNALGRLFVETGTDKGGCVQRALDVGFSRVVSIEIDENLAANASKRFALNENVTILRGSSPIVLRHVLAGILEPCTFWLDAHPEHDSPLLRELALFTRHPIKTHMILIDDRRLMQGHWPSVKEAQVRHLLKKINPSYQIITVPGAEPDDIIVAHV